MTISVHHAAVSRLSLAATALVLILITACGTTSETAPTVVSENTQPAQATPTTEAPPKPASDSNDSAPARSQPTLAPVATLSPVEAQPTSGPKSSTQAASSTATPAPVSAATPLPQNNNVSPTATTAPSPAATALTVAPIATSPVPDNTPAPTAAPITTPTPLPTVAIAPTPRPTPGPISRSTNFVPLDEPAYVTRENASANITNDSYVLGVANNGEARAYPLDMMWYHHIANDTVGGEPWLVTY